MEKEDSNYCHILVCKSGFTSGIQPATIVRPDKVISSIMGIALTNIAADEGLLLELILLACSRRCAKLVLHYSSEF